MYVFENLFAGKNSIDHKVTKLDVRMGAVLISYFCLSKVAEKQICPYLVLFIQSVSLSAFLGEKIKFNLLLAVSRIKCCYVAPDLI